MTYLEIVDKINSISNVGLSPSLKRIEEILRVLGNPHKKLKFVHVAGTNGKGTTASFIATVLQKAGYKTGLFTSPYIENFTERFKIDGEEIEQDKLINLYKYLNEKIKSNYTQFDFITALSLLWFAQNNCEIVVLEVGLGGRFDATNIIENPLVSIICSISLDHTQILGDTVEKIAFEKAGIIKDNSTLVLYPKQEKSVINVITNVCKEKNTALKIPSTDVEIIKTSLLGTVFKIDECLYEIPFSGVHQVFNALTALKALEEIILKGYKISRQNIIDGFKETKITARIELISENPLIILDGGHNEDGAKALANLLRTQLSNKKITAIVGMVTDKDSEKFFEILAPLFSEIILTRLDNPRSCCEFELEKLAKKYCQNTKSAPNIHSAINLATKFEALVVCGSLFLAGEARQTLTQQTQYFNALQ